MFIEERTKGFFRESVSEYKLKFDETDRMEEFILFIENQIVWSYYQLFINICHLNIINIALWLKDNDQSQA